MIHWYFLWSTIATTSFHVTYMSILQDFSFCPPLVFYCKKSYRMCAAKGCPVLLVNRWSSALLITLSCTISSWRVSFVQVRVNPLSLERGRVYFTSIKAYVANAPERGPLFEVPITVVMPIVQLDHGYFYSRWVLPFPLLVGYFWSGLVLGGHLLQCARTPCHSNLVYFWSVALLISVYVIHGEQNISLLLLLLYYFWRKKHV